MNSVTCVKRNVLSLGIVYDGGGRNVELGMGGGVVKYDDMLVVADGVSKFAERMVEYRDAREWVAKKRDKRLEALVEISHMMLKAMARAKLLRRGKAQGVQMNKEELGALEKNRELLEACFPLIRDRVVVLGEEVELPLVAGECSYREMDRLCDAVEGIAEFGVLNGKSLGRKESVFSDLGQYLAKVLRGHEGLEWVDIDEEGVEKVDRVRELMKQAYCVVQPRKLKEDEKDEKWQCLVGSQGVELLGVYVREMRGA